MHPNTVSDPILDSLQPSAIERTLSTAWAGRSIEYHPVIDSTNRRARTLGEEGAAHGTLVIADLQTAGRGRMSRTWESGSGDSVLMSLLLRPESLRPTDATGIVLISAIAVAAACEKMSAQVSIKWPNDLISNGKKLCGMLLDMKMGPEFVEYAIIGIGVNVKTHPQSEEIPHATCLQDACGKEVLRQEVVSHFLNHFEALYALWRTKGIDAVLPLYREYSITLGRRVRVIGLNETFEALAIDVLADGGLIVETDDGIRKTVYAGDVSVRGVMDYV
ncbi:MAG: biotin--[Clostridia bacterium]|nr:biotin--[acetyl-CoA-carboxylase] ligase [Clostridia bacterium]